MKIHRELMEFQMEEMLEFNKRYFSTMTAYTGDETSPLNFAYFMMYCNTVRYLKSWTFLFSSAVFWKSTYPATVQQWKKELFDYSNIGKTIVLENYKLTLFETVWREVLQDVSTDLTE